MRVFVLSTALMLSSAVFLASANDVGNGGGDPNLSDVMKSAASGNQSSSSPDHHHNSGGSYANNSDSDDWGGSLFLEILGAFHGVSYADQDYLWQLPVDAGFVVPFNSDIQYMTRFSLTPFCFETDHGMLGLYVNGGIVELKPGSLPDLGVSGARTIGFGMTYRYYLNAPERFLGPYIVANVGWEQLSWDYQNPITDPGGGTIHGDSLNGLDTCAGFGLAVLRNHRLGVYGEVGVGGMFFVDQTFEGYHNDVFNDFGYFEIKAGLSLKF